MKQRIDAMPHQTEAEFQAQLQHIAELFGWTLQYHTWRSDHSGPGFPDLVLVHPDQRRVLFVECKALDKQDHPKQLTETQRGWLDALRQCGQEVHVWSPRDWDDIETVLERKR